MTELSLNPATPLPHVNGRLATLVIVSVLVHIALLMWFRFDLPSPESSERPIRLTLISPPDVSRERRVSMDKPQDVENLEQETIRAAPESGAAKPRSKHHPSMQRNWPAVARRYISREADRKRLQTEQGKALWSKAPSLMHGPPPDWLGEQKPLMVTGEAVVDLDLEGRGKAFRGIGIALVNECFVGLKAVDIETIARNKRAGRSTPIGLLSCDF